MRTMSLTSMLKTKRVREIFNQNFYNPVKRHGHKIIVPLNRETRLNYGGIGMAYDYWVRCSIIKNEKKRIDEIMSFIGIEYCRNYYGDNQVVQQKTTDYIDIIFNWILEKQINSDKIYDACLFFALFETEFRCGYPVESFEISEHDRHELERIVFNTDLTWAQGKNIILNPTFGISGKEMGISADGDLIVDDVLYDLKTSSIVKLKENWRQLLGYYILNQIANKPYHFTKIGVYYPRFKCLIVKEISEFLTIEGKKNLKNFFLNELGSIKVVDRTNGQKLIQSKIKSIFDSFIQNVKFKIRPHHFTE